MANTLPSAIADAYKAAEIVGAETVGFLTSGLLNTGSEAVAKDASIKSLKTEEPTLNSSVTPAMTIPEGDDQTITEDSFALDQVANVQINITGEGERTLDTHYNFETVHGNRFLRAFRKIRNTIESYAAGVAYKGASRAYGTAGTTPFGSNFNEVAEIRQLLEDNGYFGENETSLVISNAAATNLRQLAQLQKANEAGGDDLLRRGSLLDLQGIMIKQSAGVKSHTKGTGSAYETSAAEAVGSTTINLDTGSGTILAGDILTFTGDSVNKYVVNTAYSGGTLTIAAPGIQTAVAENTVAAVGNNYTANVAIWQPCFEIAARPMLAPSGGDAADMVERVQDPITGLVYEIREYRGFHKAMWSITVVYAAKVWQPEGVAVLIG